MSSLGCTGAERTEILELVGLEATVQAICDSMNVSSMGVVKSVVAYTYTAASTPDPGVNVSFLLFSGYLVFLMQAGFALVCAGSVRVKNTMNILLKNIIDACTSAIFFYLIGYGFAYGAEGKTNDFIGNWDFALKETSKTTTWESFFFQWAFSAAAATITSGAVAERCSFIAYFGYSCFISAFVYPVVVHWVWAPAGWLNASALRPASDRILDMGAIDYAGSGVVHLVGGVAAFWGAVIVGPRIERFDKNNKPLPMPGHNATLVCLGMFLLWVGWYGFNPGSQLAVTGANAAVVARVAVTTTLGAAGGGLAALFVTYALDHKWNMIIVANGILAGLVSITAGCSVIEPWAAILAGLIGGTIFVYGERWILSMCIDDPVGAIALHGMCGAWGVLFPGFLAYYKYVNEVYGGDRSPVEDFQGILYGGHGQILLCNSIEVVVIIAWVSLMMGTYFYAMNRLGWLRVSREVELQGLDVTKHGGFAYHAASHKYSPAIKHPEVITANPPPGSDDGTEKSDK